MTDDVASSFEGEALIHVGPYRIDPAVLRRFDSRQTVFSRAAGVDKRADVVHRGMTLEDLAEARASRAVHNHLRRTYRDESRPMTFTDTPPPLPPAEAAQRLKEVARRCGACLTGVTRVNPLWLYSHDEQGRAIVLPEGVTMAVVIAVAMPPSEIAASPGLRAVAATNWGYSQMSVAAVTLAEYIRALGHRAIPSGNDTGLTIPLAVDAGLGVMGRSGLLLTDSHGSCVRLAKVFTDMPLTADSPKSEGVEHVCTGCGRCAKACPAGAISDAPQPEFHAGIMRWPVDGDRCHAFWSKNGASCSTCIAACPFGRRQPADWPKSQD